MGWLWPVAEQRGDRRRNRPWQDRLTCMSGRRGVNEKSNETAPVCFTSRRSCAGTAHRVACLPGPARRLWCSGRARRRLAPRRAPLKRNACSWCTRSPCRWVWWLGRSLLYGRELRWAGALDRGGQSTRIVPELDLVVVVTAGYYQD
jgi:hypothetical protein